MKPQLAAETKGLGSYTGSCDSRLDEMGIVLVVDGLGGGVMHDDLLLEKWS